MEEAVDYLTSSQKQAVERESSLHILLMQTWNSKTKKLLNGRKEGG